MIPLDWQRRELETPSRVVDFDEAALAALRNATVPGRVAKIVSSRPMPVPSPGRNFVPRCRTRIIPALTSWPEKIFTPSIFGFESRPLRDEPSPFL